jgi:arylsulfatase A-like enzyme
MIGARLGRTWLVWLCSVFCLSGASQAEAGPPNVLFLFADDMRADSIAALGDAQVVTPHLDRLVQRGFTIQNAYCLGSNMGAVCLPSRNMLLSGRAYFRYQPTTPPFKVVGAADPAGPNFPRVFNDAGYVTYHYGKKGNTAPAIQSLFQVNRTLANDDEERRSGEPGQLIVDDALEFLQQDRGGRPFCMYLAFGNPHDPRGAAAQYLEQYQPARLKLWPNVLPQHPFDNGEMTVRDEQLLPWPRTEGDIRRTVHEYYATITGLDHHIGRLLERLDQLGLTESTIIVFSADHGIAIGSHGLLGKQNLYDHSMRVPMVFAGPGIEHGRSPAMMYLLDVGATLFDLAGLPVPSDRDGRSAAPVIRRQAREHRRELLLAYRDVQRAYRDHRWKLMRYPQVNVTQLFDLERDPDERVNLAESTEGLAMVTQLRARMEALQQSLGDHLPWTSATPRSAEWQPPAKKMP